MGTFTIICAVIQTKEGTGNVSFRRTVGFTDIRPTVNMAIVEAKNVIQFLRAKGVAPVEIHLYLLVY